MLGTGQLVTMDGPLKYLTLFFALFAFPMQTSAADCLPEPTRVCLFQLALEQADAATRPAALASGYLHVAFMQESAGLSPAATLSSLEKQLETRLPDPAKQARMLGSAAITISLSDLPIEALSETQGWLNERLAKLATQEGIAPVAAKNAPLPADRLRAIAAQVKAAPADALPKFARLAGLTGVLPLPRLTSASLHELPLDKATLLRGLLSKGAMTAAQTEIDGWTDPAQRAAGLAALALAHARAGQLDTAKALTRRAELASPAALPFAQRFDLARLWARAGDRAQVASLFNSAGLSIQTDEELVLAMMEADLGQTRDLLANMPGGNRWTGLPLAIDAVIEDGPALTEALVAVVPAGTQPLVLYSLGRVSVEIGDVASARQTLEQLDTIGDPLGFYSGSLRENLAPLLAATGARDEAVRIAVEAGHAPLTARVAAQLP